MASVTHNPTLENSDDHQDANFSVIKPDIVRQWDDVTDAFKKASGSMEVGEMIHSKSFSLYAAMSAMELMDPRMDIGCGTVKNADEVLLPATLSDLQVINIMDQLLACEMSWLDAHTLPQTVFSCVYAQRLPEVPRPELFSFLRVQIATMDMIVNLILEERVAEEEDFISWTFGFRLCPLRHGGHAEDDQILEAILCEAKEFSANMGDEDTILEEEIYTRIKFRVHFYRTLRYLTNKSLSESTDEAIGLLNELRDLTCAWESCSSIRPVDQDLIKCVFDESINRHLVTCTPPRTAPLLQVQGAFKYIHELISELTALVNLQHLALPRGLCTPKEFSEGTQQRYSLHVAIHAIESFCAEYKPKILTRTLLSRLMAPEQTSTLFGRNDADYLKLISADMGLCEDIWNENTTQSFEKLTDGVLNIFKCMCRNRSRQRRQIPHVLRWWDHYSLAAWCSSSSKDGLNGIDEGSENKQVSTVDDVLAPSHEGSRTADKSNNIAFTNEAHYFDRRTPLQIVAYEVSARLLIQHLLLGFEVELYQEYEYAAVFFYIGYTLTATTHATASFIKTWGKQAKFHPLRLALYVMDEARLWLCRALYSTLEALSTGDQWDYNCNRASKVSKAATSLFGSEELWYEQRFGVVDGLRNGPAYADYSSFLAFKTMQDESLHSGVDETDIVLLRLREAASGFLAARRKAEKAKRAAEQCDQNFVTEEVLKIARVAIENSLVVSILLRSYEDRTAESQKKYRVMFKFNRHQHFPVLEVVERE